MNGTMYLIDGVRVSHKIFNRRKIFGEYPGAVFQIIELRRRDERPAR